MLRALPDLPAGVLGFEAVGEVHADDYRQVLGPAVDRAAAAGPVRLVYVLGHELTGYSAEASWQDARLGAEHLRAWERTAIVSDEEWVAHLVGAAGWMLPGHVRRFAVAELPDAIRWAAGEEATEAAADEVPAEGSATGSEASMLAAVGGPEPVEPSPAEDQAPTTSPEAGPELAEPVAAEPGPESAPRAEPEPSAAPADLATQLNPALLTPAAPLAPGAEARVVPPVTVPTPPQVPAQWAADPSGRHQHRWWDGERWTEHVADGGRSSVDPLP